MNGPTITQCRDRHEIAQKAASLFIKIAQQAIAEQGIFTVALSGGSTPREMYGLLPLKISEANVDVNTIHLFWGDERFVPPDHEESNYRMAKEALIDPLHLPNKNSHRIRTELGEGAAAAYEDEIRNFFQGQHGIYPRFDLMLLGMGEDGHTASLFPYTPVVSEEKKLVSAVFIEHLQARRFTMTPPLINTASHIIFLVSGKKKAAALREVLDGKHNPEKFPAQVVRSTGEGKVTWLVDSDAAELINIL